MSDLKDYHYRHIIQMFEELSLSDIMDIFASILENYELTEKRE